MSHDDLPYVGVAAWTSKPPATTLLASIRRAVTGPSKRELVALPESRYEVETIAADLPKPSTVLLGARATETNFKQLPLNQYNVIHLALHGYVDPEYPDRSALVFAPEQPHTDDGLLQVREIRDLRFNASLVTLSACDTGVGPVGEEGAANIVNAFIEAGAQSVVSTLWELEDHATAHLMTDFYADLSHREEKAEALRQAQLEMLNSGAPPYYWAGFVLDGEPNGNLFPETGIQPLFKEQPMTVNSAASAALRIQISPRDRRAILNNVLAALQKRFYSPEKLNEDWQAAVERCRPMIENANTG